MVEGVESVVLPCKTTVQPPNNATVEWSRNEPWPMIVHVYQNGSDHPDTQNWFYRNCTKMKKDRLQNKDLSLVLKDPTLFDSGTYTCTVSKDGHVLKKTNIRLHVRGQYWCLFCVFGPLCLWLCLFDSGGLHNITSVVCLLYRDTSGPR